MLAFSRYLSPRRCRPDARLPYGRRMAFLVLRRVWTGPLSSSNEADISDDGIHRQGRDWAYLDSIGRARCLKRGQSRAGLPHIMALEPAPRARSNCESCDLNSTKHHDDNEHDLNGTDDEGMPCPAPLLSITISTLCGEFRCNTELYATASIHPERSVQRKEGKCREARGHSTVKYPVGKSSFHLRYFRFASAAAATGLRTTSDASHCVACATFHGRLH